MKMAYTVPTRQQEVYSSEKKKLLYSSCGNQELCWVGSSVLQETEKQMSSDGKSLGIWSPTGLEGDLKRYTLLRDEETDVECFFFLEIYKGLKTAILSTLYNKQ